MHIPLPVYFILALPFLFLLAMVPVAHADSCSGATTCQSCIGPNNGCAWCSTDNRCTIEWYSCDTGALVAYPETCSGAATVSYTTTTTIDYNTTTTIDQAACSSYGTCASCADQSNCKWCFGDSTCLVLGTGPDYCFGTGAAYGSDQCTGYTGPTYTSTIDYNTTTTIDYNTTTVYYTSTVESTTTIESGSCPAGEILGGLPSSPICYPQGIDVGTSGGASIVDMSGAQTSDLTVGSVVSTQSGAVTQTYPGFTLKFYPDTVAGLDEVSIDPSGASSSESSAYYTTFDSQARLMGLDVSSALINHLALEHILALAKTTPFVSTMITTPFAMMEIAHGEIELAHTTLQNIKWGVKCAASSDAMACRGGTNFTMNVQDNGTTISVVDGPVLVASLSAPNSTLKYITLESGQQLFIPHNQTQAAVQDLNSSIVEFTPASSGGGATLIIVIFIVALAAGYWLRRRGKKNAAEDKEDRSVVKDKKPSRKTRA